MDGRMIMETTREIINELHKVLCEQYEKQLEVLPVKRMTREILIDGFKDGAWTGIKHVLEMLDVKIHEDVKMTNDKGGL
jgi:histone H3/H4